jgi:hypothetical protein
MRACCSFGSERARCNRADGQRGRRSRGTVMSSRRGAAMSSRPWRYPAVRCEAQALPSSAPAASNAMARSCSQVRSCVPSANTPPGCSCHAPAVTRRWIERAEIPMPRSCRRVQTPCCVRLIAVALASTLIVAGPSGDLSGSACSVTRRRRPAPGTSLAALRDVVAMLWLVMGEADHAATGAEPRTRRHLWRTSAHHGRGGDRPSASVGPATWPDRSGGPHRWCTVGVLGSVVHGGCAGERGRSGMAGG